MRVERGYPTVDIFLKQQDVLGSEDKKLVKDDIRDLGLSLW